MKRNCMSRGEENFSIFQRNIFFLKKKVVLGTIEIKHNSYFLINQMRNKEKKNNTEIKKSLEITL